MRMNRAAFVTVLAVIVAGLTASPGAYAQTTNAQIVGDVSDPTGAAIPGASVTVTSQATGVGRTVQSNELGQYRVYPLIPGTYDVAVENTGFKRQVRSGVVVEVAAIVKVDFRLDLGEVTETIEVTGAAPTLQTQDASVGGTVNEIELQRIAVNGRNYTRLILMMPGTSNQITSQTRGTQSGTALISVNGGRPQDNNFTMDGVDNNMMMMNSPGSSPPMDAIQEFRVATNNNAEFGRSMGANVNIAIKSGTRDLHGSAYWYVRNDVFDANNFFANRSGTGIVPFRQNQYGTSAGGPVPGLRDSTFWFFNWEGHRRRRGGTAFTNVPTQQMRNGDFSQRTQRIYNPFTGRADGNSIVRDPFENNTIPKSMHHPSITKFLEIMIPQPNLPGLTQNYINTASASNDRDFLVARGDHHASEKDIFSVRYLHQNVGQLDPQSNPYLSTQARVDHRNLMATWTHIMNPTSTLEVRFGYNNPRNPDCTLNSQVDRGTFLDQTGIQLFERNVLCQPIPTLESEGEFSAGGGGTDIDEKNWQFVSNYSKTTGSHAIKGGVNYTRRHFFTNTSNPMNGNAWFNGTLTSLSTDANSGFSTASMLLGVPRQIRRASGETLTNARINAWQFFIQDDWRISSKLTFNFGMRYEWNNAPYDTSDLLGNLWVYRDPQTGVYEGRLMWANVNPELDPVTGERNQPARTYDFGRALMQNDSNNIAPRLGLAYQWDNKTVIRAGVGVFYNSTFVQELQDLRKFWPYVPQQVFEANNVTAASPLPTFFIDSPGPSYSSTSEIGGWPQNPENRSPYATQWNLFIQRELLQQMTLDVGYVGSASKKQVGYTAINAPLTPGPGAIQPRRLLSKFGNIDGGANRFSGEYNGLQLALNKRFSSGLGFRMNYTWSKSMDEQSSLAEWKAQDPFNIRNDWSRSSWDVGHVFQMAYQYELPFGRGKRHGAGWSSAAEALLGGWSVHGFTRFNTGPPTHVVSGRDIANVGRTYQRPDVTCDPNNGPRTAEQWYAKDCFRFPANFAYGNAGAFIVHAPGINSWDISVGKQWQIRENHRFLFRTEFFNAFNTTNFHRPGGNNGDNWSASSVARISSLDVDPRQIQFALRYEF